MATRTFNDANGTQDWADPLNWDVPPIATDDVVIDNAALDFNSDDLVNVPPKCIANSITINSASVIGGASAIALETTAGTRLNGSSIADVLATITGDVILNSSSRQYFSGQNTTIVPAMTDDTTPAGYVASASASVEGTFPYQIFNRIRDGAPWGAAIGAAPITPVQIGVQIPAGVAVNAYAIRARGDAYSNGAPKDFELQGSNDGAAWTTIDSRTNQSWSASERKFFNAANATAYTYYRLNVTACAREDYLTFDELELFSAPQNVRVLAPTTGTVCDLTGVSLPGLAMVQLANAAVTVQVNTPCRMQILDANLAAGNIKNGTTILGIEGSYAGGGGTGGDAVPGDVRLNKTFTNDEGLQVGTRVILDPSSATATAADIATGKTAMIADGSIVPGSAIIASGNAQPGDLRAGKSASNASGAFDGALNPEGGTTVTIIRRKGFGIF